LVRSAAVKYANRSDLTTLADKVDFIFKTKLLPNATKNKAKSVEEEVCLPFFIHNSDYRNNSKSRRRYLMNMKTN
jgi:hypothetical protein